jgi:hypothetical protein
MENTYGKIRKFRKYSQDESRKILQKYAIDVASGVKSELKNIDILEYITCLSEDDRYTFANLEKKIRRYVISELEDTFVDNHGCRELVNYDTKSIIGSSLRNMSSDELVKITSAFEQVCADFIADAIMKSLKESIES